MINEAQIITEALSAFPQYIGDDAAVIPLNQNEQYVISKDLLIENIHFRLEDGSAENLAHKALHVNLSDIAAMGAKPAFVLLGIATPSTYEIYTKTFLHAFTTACKDANVILIGGDTSRAPEHLCISVTVIGVATREQIKYRHTAVPGDIIAIAGNLGHAHIGLTAFLSSTQGLETFKHHFLNPFAKVAEGIWLGEQSAVRSMMDLSDGLWVDLNRLMNASKIGAHIHLDKLQLTQEFTHACQSLMLDPVETCLVGGEDYSLLCTIKSDVYPELSNAFQHTFKYPLRNIGHITKEHGVKTFMNGVEKTLLLTTFSHFGEENLKQ